MIAEQQVNSPNVIGVLVAIAVLGVIVIFLTSIFLLKLDEHKKRRGDKQIFKAVKEARRDFR